MFNNFQIFYQPSVAHRKNVKSISLKLYDCDEANDTYRKKVIIERVDGEEKQKDVYKGIQEVVEKIQTIRFNTGDSNIDMDDEYYLIKCGQDKIQTNRREDVQEILTLFNFPEI